MAFDLTKTHEVKNGLSITTDGIERHVLASGAEVPSGTAPLGSRYERFNGEVWTYFIGGWGMTTSPVESQAVAYDGDDEVDFVTFYKSATQTTPNRIADVTFTYTTGDPTTETWKFYDPADGTTVLQTSTLTHTFSAGEYQSTARVDA